LLGPLKSEKAYAHTRSNHSLRRDFKVRTYIVQEYLARSLKDSENFPRMIRRYILSLTQGGICTCCPCDIRNDCLVYLARSVVTTRNVRLECGFCTVQIYLEFPEPDSFTVLPCEVGVGISKTPNKTLVYKFTLNFLSQIHSLFYLARSVWGFPKHRTKRRETPTFP
jgi:hypothetical protein